MKLEKIITYGIVIIVILAVLARKTVVAVVAEAVKPTAQQVYDALEGEYRSDYDLNQNQRLDFNDVVLAGGREPVLAEGGYEPPAEVVVRDVYRVGDYVRENRVASTWYKLSGVHLPRII